MHVIFTLSSTNLLEMTTIAAIFPNNATAKITRNIVKKTTLSWYSRYLRFSSRAFELLPCKTSRHFIKRTGRTRATTHVWTAAHDTYTMTDSIMKIAVALIAVMYQFVIIRAVSSCVHYFYYTIIRDYLSHALIY